MTIGGIKGEILPEPEGFSKGSGYISPYILIQDILQTFSISRNDTSSIVLPDWAILEELIFHIALAAGPIFYNIRPGGQILDNIELSWMHIIQLNKKY